MKQWMSALVFVAVSASAVAEDHAAKQTQQLQQPQQPSQSYSPAPVDSSLRLLQMINACLVQQGAPAGTSSSAGTDRR